MDLKNYSAFKMAFLAISILAGLAVLTERIAWIYSQPYPLDYSGFYYLQEIKSRLLYGVSYYAHYSLFFTLTEVAGLICDSPETILSFFISLSYLLLISSLTIITWKFSQSLALTGGYFFLLTTLDSIFLQVYSYPRQALSASMLVLGLLLLHRAKNSLSIMLCILITVFAAAMHILASIALVIYIIFARLPWQFRSIVLLLALITTALNLLITDRFFGGIFSFNLESAFSSAFSRGWIGNKEYLEYRFSVIIAIMLSLILLLDKRFDLRTLLFLLAWAVLVLPVWSADLNGYALRALRFSVLLLFVSYSIALAALLQSRYKWFAAFLPYTLLVSYIAPENSKIPRFGQIGPPKIVYELEKNKQKLKQFLSGDSLVLAPHGIQFQITYLLGVRAVRSDSLNYAPKTADLKIFRLERKSPDDRCIKIEIARPEDSCVEIGSYFTLQKL